MVITERDTGLLKKLSQYGMLSTKQINFLCFNSIAQTTVLRRLRALEKNKYIKRILGLESHEVLWSVIPKGAVLAEVPVPKWHWSKNLLEHDFKLVSLRLALEGSGLSHSWITEHEIRSSIFRTNGFRDAKDKLIPDGLMGIEIDGKKQSLAIELELTLKNRDKLRKTLSRYKDKNGIVGVWYIVPFVSILNSITMNWRKAYSINKNACLYLSLLPDLLKNPLEAKVFGYGNGKHAKELWAPKLAQETAHSVSTLDEKLSPMKID